MGYYSPSAEVLGMEKPRDFITPTAFLSQENEVPLRVGQCYTMVTHSMVSQIMPEDFVQSLVLDEFRLVALAIKNHHSRFLFLLLPLLFLSSPALAPLWLFQSPHRYLCVCDPSCIWTLCMFPLTLNLNFPFLIFFFSCHCELWWPH